VWEEGKITVLGDKDVTLIALNTNQINIVVSRTLVFPKNDGEGSAPDVTTLHHLSRPAILHALIQRYNGGNIYTYSGAILIAVNPYKLVRGLYGQDAMKKAHQGLGASEPHVYNVVERAYRAMTRTGMSQSILVSGESGAGKTETTKHVLTYLAYITSNAASGSGNSGGNSIKDRILASTPLLEALGNAKTIYNDNSSRFGKYIRVLFDTNGSIVGASIQTYLLERSRIVKPKPGERNFHIFYQLIKSLSKEKRRQYFVVDVTSVYKYLQGSEYAQHDEEDYKKTLAALTKLGFSQEEQDTFHFAISTVLALGNIEFKEEGKEIVVSEPRWLQLAASLLNCDVELLKNALTQKLVTATHGMNAVTPGSVYVIRHTKAKCEQSRDSMAMLVYTRLLNWVVKRINDALKPPINASSTTTGGISLSSVGLSSIGVLDIYGFESFEKNGLDQLCINYANEKLQRQFNQQVFTRELEEYRNEGIDCESITYADNSNVIDAIEGTSSVPGVAQYLDDQSKVASGGNDGAFIRSLLSSSVDKSVLRKPDKGSIDSFMICHYADRVVYTGEGFVERNTDYVVDEHMTVLKRQECVLYKLVEEEEKAPDSARGRAGSNSALQRTGSFRKGTGGTGSSTGLVGGGAMVLTTVISRFRGSLDELIATITTTETHYIRCIKPNGRKQPDTVEKELVVRQLGCGGVFETVRVIMAGYPTRVSLDKLVEHYGYISMKKSGTKTEIAEELLRTIAIAIGVSGSKIKPYRIGKTKVFLAAGIAAKLDHRRLVLDRAVLLAQKRWKGIRQRRKYRRIILATKLLKACCRGKVYRLLFAEVRRVNKSKLLTRTTSASNASGLVSPTTLVSPPTLPSVSPRPVVTPSVTPREDKIGWKSGSVSSIIQERNALYEKEIQALKEELVTTNNRTKEKDVLLTKLEGVLGTPISGFDSIRAELAKHYDERSRLVTRELNEEKTMRGNERRMFEEQHNTLLTRCELLAKDVEELRTKTEKAKAEHKEKRQLESRVKELEKEVDLLRKTTTTQTTTQTTPRTNEPPILQQSYEDGSERYMRATSIVASALGDLVKRVTEYHADVSTILASVEPTEQHLVQLQGLPKQLQQHQATLLEALSSVHHTITTKAEHISMLKGIMDRIGQHENILSGRLRQVEDAISPDVLTAIISNAVGGAMGTMQSEIIHDVSGSSIHVMNHDVSVQFELNMLMESLGASEPTCYAIMRAIKQQQTTTEECTQQERIQLVARYEERIQVIDQENRRINQRIEQLLSDMNNDS